MAGGGHFLLEAEGGLGVSEEEAGGRGATGGGRMSVGEKRS